MESGVSSVRVKALPDSIQPWLRLAFKLLWK